MSLKDFRERQYLVPLTRSLTFRCSEGLFRTIQTMALQENADASLIVRYLCNESLQKDGRSGVI